MILGRRRFIQGCFSFVDALLGVRSLPETNGVRTSRIILDHGQRSAHEFIGLQWTSAFETQNSQMQALQFFDRVYADIRRAGSLQSANGQMAQATRDTREERQPKERDV